MSGPAAGSSSMPRTSITERLVAALTAADPDLEPGPGRADGERRWWDRAACRRTDPETFFPTAEAGAVYLEQVARAKAVCARCPVQAPCLEFALQALPEGIAGATTPQERRALVHGGRTQGGRPDQGNEVTVTRHGATRSEVCAAGRAALRAGWPTRTVARQFAVSERTAQRWASQLRATSPPAPEGARPPINAGQPT